MLIQYPVSLLKCDKTFVAVTLNVSARNGFNASWHSWEHPPSVPVCHWCSFCFPPFSQNRFRLYYQEFPISCLVRAVWQSLNPDRAVYFKHSYHTWVTAVWLFALKLDLIFLAPFSRRVSLIFVCPYWALNSTGVLAYLKWTFLC